MILRARRQLAVLGSSSVVMFRFKRSNQSGLLQSDNITIISSLMYSKYLLQTSTANYPSYRPPHPNHSSLQSSRIDFTLKKPSFLINDDENHLTNSAFRRQQVEGHTYGLSRETAERLERLQRNPFLKHTQVMLKHNVEQQPDNSSNRFKWWHTRNEPSLLPEEHKQLSQDFGRGKGQRYQMEDYLPQLPQFTLEQPHRHNNYPAQVQNPEQRESRIEEILAQVGRSVNNNHSFGREESKQVRRDRPPSKTRFPDPNDVITQGIYQHFEEDRNQNNRATIESAHPKSIIHALAEEHMQPQDINEGLRRGLGHLVSSQVHEFQKKDTAEFDDPIRFWAKQGSQRDSSHVPESIIVRGAVFEHVEVR